MQYSYNDDFAIVALGASAGNQKALEAFFSEIPPDLNACFVVVIHLLQHHHTIMPRIIQGFTEMPVIRVTESCALQAGFVYVMPEDVTMCIRNRTLHLQPRLTKRNVSVDSFFESLSKDQEGASVAVVLSGMGTDGTQGANDIHDRGGRVLVQDPDTTEFKGMPQSVIWRDHPELVSSPENLGRAIVKIVNDRNRLPIH